MSASFNYGGQALIEGVMMRGPDSRAIAVRLPDQSIIVDEKQVIPLANRVPVFKWPLVRGVVALFEALVMGIEALTYSANQAVGEDEKLTTREIVITIGLALALAILLFAVLPTAAAHMLTGIAPGTVVQNLLEGLLRIGIFLAYVMAISRMSDIRRVFQYHGAEHKVINAYEAGEELTVERVQRHSTLHPRCGTSFILIVLVISIMVFSLLGQQELLERILSRVILLPVVAGISYELLKLSAKHRENSFWQALISPGLWLQKLTTGQPDDEQVEVALTAFNAVAKES